MEEKTKPSVQAVIVIVYVSATVVCFIYFNTVLFQ